MPIRTLRARFQTLARSAESVQRVGRLRAVATSLVACGIGLAVASNVSADPAESDADSAEPPSVWTVVPGLVDPTPEARAACAQFGRARDLAAINYLGFANTLAIGEVNPNYSDPILSDNNIIGRTALREAAAEALSASRVPGLQPEIAGPMRSWSLDAVKLLLLMGMRANVDRINNVATQLNSHNDEAQMACTHAGART